ncbi:MAG TPA: hypothetical protein VG939_09420, partial [Caulobacteraceae bacterium]|nr:hypothetical protein [Caulobacteraceae bacterium]
MAAVATVAHAESTTVTSGYIEGHYTRPDTTVSGLGDQAVDVWGVNGAVALPLSGNWGAQVDADVSDYTFSNIDPALNDRTVFTPTAHAYYRTDRFLGGAFVGTETTQGATAWGGGFEGQAYVTPKWTLDGSVGYAGVNDTDLTMWGVRGGARYFVTDNLSLKGSVNWVRASVSGAGHSDLWNLGVGGEYQLKSVPLALTLGYERGEWHDVDAHSDTIRVGIKWSFGGGTLHDRDRHGASLGSISDTFGGEA